MLYYRPAPTLKDYRTMAPKEYAEFERGVRPAWPCNKLRLPLKTVHVWRQRALFVKLVNEAIKGITTIRDLNCSEVGYPEGGFGRPKISPAPVKPVPKFELEVVRRIINRERVSNAALTYLHGIAFSNFFCVQ